MIFEDKKPITKRVFINDFSNFKEEKGDIIIQHDQNFVILNYDTLTIKEYCEGDLTVMEYPGVNGKFYFNEFLEKLDKHYNVDTYRKIRFCEMSSGMGGTFTVRIYNTKYGECNVVTKQNCDDFNNKNYRIKKDKIIEIVHKGGLVL